MDTKGLYDNVYWGHPSNHHARQIEFAQTMFEYNDIPDECYCCLFSIVDIDTKYYCNLIKDHSFYTDDPPHCTVTDFLKYLLENI